MVICIPLPTSHYRYLLPYYSLTGLLPSTSYKLPVTRCLPYLPRYPHTHYLITDISYPLPVYPLHTTTTKYDGTCFFSTQCGMECREAKRTAIPLAPPGMIDECVCDHETVVVIVVVIEVVVAVMVVVVIEVAVVKVPERTTGAHPSWLIRSRLLFLKTIYNGLTLYAITDTVTGHCSDTAPVSMIQ